MNSYVTGAVIKKLREEKNLTQNEFANLLGVTDKSVSKWETGRGYPDITLIEPISEALGISVIELFSGSDVENLNKSANMKKLKFYVCPICSNIIVSTGEAVMSCCGVTLPPLEAEKPDEKHTVTVQSIEDEYYVTADHPMSKTHYISFMAAVRDNGADIVKLYPQGGIDARFKIGRTEKIYYYCNKHGLFYIDIK